MTWKRKIPGEGACGPCCSWKERFNQLWDRAIGCIVKINNITPDGDGKFEIRGGTGVQVTPISNGVEINSTATGAGIATINNTAPDSDNNFTIAGASGRNGVTVTGSTHGVSLSIGDFVSTINDVTADVFGNINLTEGSNITITPDNDNSSIEVALASSPSVSGMEINGDLEVNGDIIQNGSAYETHAEQIFTKDDYVIMRDGAVAGLATGDYAGFQVKKYDGTNDGRLVIDKDGTARVGDVGDEQPLLTREEVADLSDGDILTWDANDGKAVGITDNMVRTSRLNKIGDFYNIAITSAQTVNVGANWTALAIYSGIASRGNSISFSNGNKFTINENGVYMIQLTNRHDSGSFGGSGIEYPNGFVEATGDKASEIRTQFITLEMNAGQIITIKQYGDQGTMPGYAALNQCIITRIQHTPLAHPSPFDNRRTHAVLRRSQNIPI